MGALTMNFVWLYEGKQTNELELSLALVKKFYPNAHTICITTSTKLPFFDQIYEPLKVLPNKHADQLYKLRHALEFLPDEFCVMNDDFFILGTAEEDGDINGRLSNLLAKRKAHDDYYMTIQNTITMLDELEFPLWNFELHKPLLVNKVEMQRAFALLNGDEPAILWRSLYGNSSILGRTAYNTDTPDVKNIPFGTSWCLSTDGFSFPRYRYKLKEVLNG